jgi:hypothetical protein
LCILSCLMCTSSIMVLLFFFLVLRILARRRKFLPQAPPALDPGQSSLSRHRNTCAQGILGITCMPRHCHVMYIIHPHAAVGAGQLLVLSVKRFRIPNTRHFGHMQELSTGPSRSARGGGGPMVRSRTCTCAIVSEPTKNCNSTRCREDLAARRKIFFQGSEGRLKHGLRHVPCTLLRLLVPYCRTCPDTNCVLLIFGSPWRSAVTCCCCTTPYACPPPTLSRPPSSSPTSPSTSGSEGRLGRPWKLNPCPQL